MIENKNKFTFIENEEKDKVEIYLDDKKLNYINSYKIEEDAKEKIKYVTLKFIATDIEFKKTRN